MTMAISSKEPHSYYLTASISHHIVNGEWIAPTQEDILYAGKTVNYIILLVRSDSWFSCEKIKEAAYERMMWKGTDICFPIFGEELVYYIFSFNDQPQKLH